MMSQMNKFQHIKGAPCTVKSMMNKFEHVGGGSRALYMDPSPCGQTDTTENITILQLRWRAVTMHVLTLPAKRTVPKSIRS